MTEDDTCRVLARPDIHEMVRLYNDYKKSRNVEYSSLDNIRFAKYYGWGWLEFLTAKNAAGYEDVF